MIPHQLQIEEEQRAICEKFAVGFVDAPGMSKTGFAFSTKGRLPANGLRHPPTPETSGWFIWFGEEFSYASDFFAPLHTIHLYLDEPAIGKLLGLPPGSRFLMAGDFLDVWYDKTLLKT